jgi:uncharacterized protein YjbJ (UPF0337 family)
MGNDVLKGQWKQLKGAVKTQWGKLTDDDLTRIDGDVEQLIGRVQERYGYARGRAMDEVDAFMNRQVPRSDLSARIQQEGGAVGYILLWLLGVPASLLFVVFLLRGCT